MSTVTTALRVLLRPAPVLVLTGLAVAAAGGAAVVAASHGAEQAGARVADAFVVAAFVVTGALVLVHRPGHRVGLLLWGGGVLWGLASLPLELAVASLTAGARDAALDAAIGQAAAIGPADADHPAIALVAVLALAVRGAGWILVVALLALLFPDGRLPGPRWRPALGVALAALLVFELAVLLAPEPLDYRLSGVRNPLGVPSGWRLALDLLAVSGLGLVVLSAATGVAAAVVRWRQGDALLRQQVGALVTAAGVSLVAGIVIVADVATTAIAFPVAVMALPGAVGVAVLQHGLYDIRLAVNRALVYGVLTGAVVALYVVVVGAVGAVLQARQPGWLSLLAAGVVAVAFQPLREVVQGGVNRITYGAWGEPSQVVERLGDRLADAVAPEVTLPSVLESLAADLRLPYVAVLGRDGDVLAARGTDAEDARDVPLVHQREVVGTLRLAAPASLRPAGRAPAQARLLDALARQLAPVVHAVQLSRELQRSRERLVRSREEERRRLRRDLHDGLGPALAGLTLRVDTARNTVGRDPAVDAVLLELREEVREAVADVRRVVEDLRPPVLDDLGLLGALEALAERFAPGPPRVVVTASGPVRALPAAVEVAAYRIAQEAVSNAVRHAGAAGVSVRVGTGVAGAGPSSLRLEVEDDGSGPRVHVPRQAGNGLTTMRERAEEIGGSVVVGDGAGGGTLVVATLPVPHAAVGSR